MKINLSQLPTAYINADSETDLDASFLETMSELGYVNVTRFAGQPDVDGKVFSGIMKSNKEVLAAMKASATYPFITLEDDVKGINYNDSITIPGDADAVYLGLALLGEGFSATPVDGFPGVYKIKKPIGLHSVLCVTKRYADAFEAKLDEQISANFPNPDQAINQTIQYPLAEDFNVYAVNPVFYKHISGNPSLSNLTRVVDVVKETIDPINFG
jgi:hypothetical protein